MAKIRTVKPELFRHLHLFEAEQACGLPLRLAFIGLFGCCDREGRFRWEPHSLKLDILPYDNAINFAQILSTLWEAGFIKKYVSQNKEYGYIPSWHQHQSINKREPLSKLPNPESNAELLCTPVPSTVSPQVVSQVITPAKQEPVPAMHEDLSDSSDKDIAAGASSASISASEMFQKSTEEIIAEAKKAEKIEEIEEKNVFLVDTPWHEQELVEQVLPSANTVLFSGEKEISAAISLTDTTHTPLLHEENRSRITPIHTLTSNSQRIHPASDSHGSVERIDPYPSPFDKPIATPVLHESIRTTQNDASAKHMPTLLEMEIKKEKNQGVHRNLATPNNQTHRVIPMNLIETVFQYWKTTLQHPEALLDKKRQILIQEALQQGYTVTQLCEAISGCAKTPHNMGDNQQGQRYDGLHIILGSSDQIERFIGNYHYPPRPPNPANKLLQANIMTSKNWLQRKRNEMEIKSHGK